MLSTTNNKVERYFTIISSLVATTRIFMHNRRANVTWDTISKGEKTINALTSLKNNSKVRIWVNFPKKLDKSLFKTYTNDA